MTSLGIRYGPSHSEIMMIESGEVILIETGARMHGGKGPHIAQLNKKYTQVELTEDLYFKKGIWEQLYSGELKNGLTRTALQVLLVSPNTGFLLNSLELEEVKNLESFYEYQGLEKGDYVEETRDLVTSPG